MLRQMIWDEVGHQEINGLQRRHGGAVRLLDRATSTHLQSERRMPSIFTWFYLYWPKTTYLKGPLGVPERRWRRNMKNTKQRLLRVTEGRSEGESLPGSPPATSPPSPTPPTCSPLWGGSSSPPGLWVCGGNLVQYLYALSLLKSIWCALHDYGTIYVIPIVVIVLWDDICYASTVVLRLYGLPYFGIVPMIHAMNLSMHNALSIM
jgi:hypothetical protein